MILTEWLKSEIKVACTENNGQRIIALVQVLSWIVDTRPDGYGDVPDQCSGIVSEYRKLMVFHNMLDNASGKLKDHLLSNIDDPPEAWRKCTNARLMVAMMAHCTHENLIKIIVTHVKYKTSMAQQFKNVIDSLLAGDVSLANRALTSIEVDAFDTTMATFAVIHSLHATIANNKYRAIGYISHVSFEHLIVESIKHHVKNPFT